MISRRWGKADCGKGASAEDFRSTPKTTVWVQAEYVCNCHALQGVLRY